ncbi:Sensor histidine kinase PrrB (RegB) [hydrothermal vent metagenome]|uniref:histidine kinase n=1 Tax=hydrothermal vent metagenome TaxID=652676 RepID=A0A3B0RPS1_9ZZZZ
MGFDSDSSQQQLSGLHGNTLIFLRWIAIIGQTGAVLLVQFALGFDLPLKSCLAVIAVSAWLNVYLGLSSGQNRRISEGNILAQLGFDLVQMGLLIGLTGGLANPFLVLFVAPVVVAVTTLRLRDALWLFVLVGLILVGLALFALPLPWLQNQAVEVHSDMYRLGMALANLITIAFTAIYVWRVSRERNRMKQALAVTEAVLAHETKLAALGGLAAATAHELGTPLGTIQLVASELNNNQSSKKSAALEADVQLILSQAKICRQILGKLSSRGAENDPYHARLTLSGLLEEICAAKINSEIALSHSISSLDMAASPDEPVLQRKPETIHALTAFLENALSFARSKVEIIGRWDMDWVTITICDDGPGFDPVILERLGEPYITSRQGGDQRAQGGLGLGFFISKNLVERTGGTIKCGSSVALGGAMVQVVWPRNQVEI